MTSIKYPFRILADIDFVKWLINKDKKKFLYLTHIKKSSIECRGEHNIMVEDDIQALLQLKIISEANLRAAFKGKTIPSEITTIHENKYDKLIVFAIALATERRPFKIYLLTTKEHEQKYSDSPHAEHVKSIAVKSEEDALKTIDILWQDFCSGRR